ncbi:13245_t:CDS:2 [Cetraspora pellucida]|uniref:13245_t:CDS:1 n=1 Tax=Cetraspora pellucida TaxID=1433469 RepID=A0A9N9IUH1_9GLOM|nr:13245_t:CDS:2 [Cetraspora pellucida]
MELDIDLEKSQNLKRLCEPNQLSASNSTLYIVDFQHLLCFYIDNVLTSALQKFVSEKTCWFKEYRLLKKSQPVVANLFVIKCYSQPSNQLKNVLKDITGTHYKMLGSNKAVLEESNIQERKKNKCTKCKKYRHNIQTCDAD